jgi:hypothetical protein
MYEIKILHLLKNIIDILRFFIILYPINFTAYRYDKI